MSEKPRLSLEIKGELVKGVPRFVCTLKEPLTFNRLEWRGFDVVFHSREGLGGGIRFGKTKPPKFEGFNRMTVNHLISTPSLVWEVGKKDARALDYGKEFDANELPIPGLWQAITTEGPPILQPITEAIESYVLTEEEKTELQAGFFQEIQPEINELFGQILKRILKEAGYIVIEIETPYFPSPTSTALIAPVFALSLQREVEPIERQEGYEITLTYLSYEKPQSKTQIQLRLLDNIPEERLLELQRRFKDALSPRGLKTLYLVIEECGENKRNPWFNLDTNRAMDLMGYKRNKKNVHEPRNKDRFIKELKDLTLIKFNVEKRQPKTSRKDQAFKFEAPLLSITGKWEEYEVDTGKPLEEGTKIKEGMQIFIHPEIYNVTKNYYTFIPHAFLKIDVGRTPHAGFLYAYIANQWRIGWSEYQGTIRQPIRQILDGAGLLDNYHRKKRRNKQRDFLEDVKEDLRSLKDNRAFWIKSVRFDTKHKPLLEQIVTIEMAEDHPLQRALKKQIEAG